MEKRIKIGLSLLLCIVIGIFYVNAIAESGRESKQLPPQQIEQMYANETWAWRVRDDSGVTIYRFDFDGNARFYNTSGTEVTVITAGKVTKVTFDDAPIYTAVTPTIAITAVGGCTRFVLPTLLDSAVIYECDTTGDIVNLHSGCTSIEDGGPRGITVVFPAVSAANDDKVFGVQKVGSGTSALICWVDGVQTIGASGGTVYASMDAIGDIMWFRVGWGSAGVSYYFTGGHIQ